MKYIPHLFLSLLLLFTSYAESGISNGLPYFSKSGVANTIAYIHPPIELVRVCGSSNDLYTVKYSYDPSSGGTIPAIDGAKIHYSAFITVFDKNNKLVSKGWFGQVIPDGGCFEDVPEEMVRLALEQRRSDVQTLAKEKLEELKGTNNWQITNVRIRTNSYPGIKIDSGIYTITNYSVSITTNLLVLTNYNLKIVTNILSFTNNVILTNKLATNIIFTNKLTTITNTVRK